MNEAEERKDLTPEELDGQEPEELPEREVMSVLHPPLPGAPVPVDGALSGTLPVPEESM